MAKVIIQAPDEFAREPSGKHVTMDVEGFTGDRDGELPVLAIWLLNAFVCVACSARERINAPVMLAHAAKMLEVAATSGGPTGVKIDLALHRPGTRSVVINAAIGGEPS